jgi:hypothetical protein
LVAWVSGVLLGGYEFINGHNLGLELLDSAGLFPGTIQALAPPDCVVFLTGTGLPYLEVLNLLAE